MAKGRDHNLRKLGKLHSTDSRGRLSRTQNKKLQFETPLPAAGCACVMLFAGSEDGTPFAGVPGCC